MCHKKPSILRIKWIGIRKIFKSFLFLFAYLASPSIYLTVLRDFITKTLHQLMIKLIYMHTSMLPVRSVKLFSNKAVISVRYVSFLSLLCKHFSHLTML